MEVPAFVIYLSAGAYIAIMIAVLGVPQLLSSYFDIRSRRQHEERQEQRRQEERRQDEERRRQDEERRRQDEERRRQDEERRRQDEERRHQELMTALIAVMSNGNNQDNGQNELIRTLQQTVEDLRAENERLRKQNGNGSSTA